MATWGSTNCPKCSIFAPVQNASLLKKTFSKEDIANYYDHTEVHYRRFWKLDKSMGLHYGIWEAGISNLAQAIRNTNVRLARLGQVRRCEEVLDAGCGVGGSAIFLARECGCRVTGITLSRRQVERATAYADAAGVRGQVAFSCQDYTQTSFGEATFDLVWAIESMQTAPDKKDFLREMKRVLKPSGRILIADVFKHGNWQIENEPLMQTMLGGWAMSDILTVEELNEEAQHFGLRMSAHQDVSQEIAPSIRRIYWASLVGMIGTKWYNLFHNATYFSKIHYKTGLAQFKAWKQGLWGYHLIEISRSEQ